MAIDAIRKNKLRSSLTLLGISIGVFSVIGVMTAIRTLESSIASGLNVFAANTFVIQKNPEFDFGQRDRKYRNRKNITIDQYKTLKDRANIPLLVSPVTGMSVRDVQYRGKKIKNSVNFLAEMRVLFGSIIPFLLMEEILLMMIFIIQGMFVF